MATALKYYSLPDGHHPFSPLGGPLLYWINTSSSKYGLSNPILTDVFDASHPKEIWKSIDEQFHWSQGNFFLLQRLVVQIPGEKLSWQEREPDAWQNISGEIKLYLTRAPERPQHQFLLLYMNDDQKSFQDEVHEPVREFSSLESMMSAVKPGHTMIGGRVLEYFFWHIHM